MESVDSKDVSEVIKGKRKGGEYVKWRQVEGY